MATLQTTYPSTQPVGIAGMPSSMEKKNTISRVVEGGGGLNFGQVAVQGAADKGAKVAAGDSKAFLGIAVIDDTLPPANAGKYVAGNTAAIMQRGTIWVTVSVNVAAGDPALFVDASGLITNVTSGNRRFGKFVTSGSAAGLAEVRVGDLS